MIPTFKNRQNICHTVNGEQIWKDRSVAVIAAIYAKTRDDVYVLIEQRSEIMEEPFKWCLPGGFFDWDEDGWESMIREVYEETGLYIPQLGIDLINDNFKQPIWVHTKPSTVKQTITLTYGLVYSYQNINMFPKVDFKCNEVLQLKWMPKQDIDKYTWAFNHDERLRQGLAFFQLKTFDTSKLIK